MVLQTDFLRNLWYFAFPSQKLQPQRIITKELLGEPILFGRTTAGQPFAIRNICPHRGIPLSYGRFDGVELECAYHGWRFDHQGKCKLIPSLTQDQQLNLENFGVPAYPVKEVQGNLWIYMPKDFQHIKPQLDVPLVAGFASDRPAQAIQTFQFPCHIDHAVVGLMDPAHGPFVHKSWWWRTKGKMFEKSKVFDPAPYGFTMRRHKLLRKSLGYHILGGHPEVEISFHLPGVRIEVTQTDKHTLCNLTTVTPINANHTEVTTMFYWTTPWISFLKPLLVPFVRNFMNQDREMVIKQQEGLKYNPPLMLIKDADTQARWYYQIKREFAKAVSENREFINPIQSQTLSWRS
jgi:phenylpropionate dioxygenase-like ring-hydroxylating dioxygenase large terminal subunit